MECRTGRACEEERWRTTLGKVFRTDIPGKRNGGRPTTRWTDAIHRDLEKFWTESELGVGQSDME